MKGRPVRALACGLGLLGGLVGGGGPGSLDPGVARAQSAPPAPTVGVPPASDPAAAAVRPGAPAPPQVVQEIQAALAQGIQRFEAKDLGGVLGHVSDQYWTGPLTKPALRAQLLGIFQIYQQVRARIRIDEVRLVGEHAWVFSTGEVSGQLPLIGQWMTLFLWERELEVARRENGVWRAFGYQQ